MASYERWLAEVRLTPKQESVLRTVESLSGSRVEVTPSDVVREIAPKADERERMAVMATIGRLQGSEMLELNGKSLYLTDRADHSLNHEAERSR